MKEEIPSYMLEKITRGEAIVFLGAGAAFDAIDGDGNPFRMSGFGLRDLLSDEFLGKEQKDKSLVQVADYSKYQAGLNEVQIFIKNLMQPLQPADFHKIIPKFKWHSIFTTNYDLIIERAYDQVKDRVQTLVPIIRDGAGFTKAVGNPHALPYIKLHGCISTINDPELPLILASEEYAKHKKNRIRLFQHLGDFGLDNPIIFCGYQIGDPNIQQILFDLCDVGISRPTYMVVDPGLNKYDIQMWNANRISTLKYTFSEFLTDLDSKIATNNRVLSTIKTTSKYPYDHELKYSANLSPKLEQYINTELEYIHSSMAFKGIEPLDFYTGLDFGWGGIVKGLDVERKISDQILVDSIIVESSFTLSSVLASVWRNIE